MDYPIERLVCTLKRFGTNIAQLEGSVAEAYIASECLTFCSRYLHDIETRQNRPRRYAVEEHETAFSVFAHNMRLIGASKTTRYEGNEALKTDLQKMSWYVLNNCKEIKPYMFSLP